MATAFPLKASSNGRYFVDQNNVPFRVHGFAVWDLHITCTRTDWQSALSTLAAQGVNTVLTYITNSVPYVTGGPQPANQNGDLPYTKDTSGNPWTGVFANANAAYDFPNDAYHHNFELFVDDCAALGILVLAFPNYAGALHTTVGDQDGWWQCLTNGYNNSTRCTGLGTYLANGHGTFGGLKGKTNFFLVIQGDSGLSVIGSAGSALMLDIFSGWSAAGGSSLYGEHITINYTPNSMTTYAPSYGFYCGYTFSTLGASYAQGRGVYAQTPVLPAFEIETGYWGERGSTRAQVRYEMWSSGLTLRGGAINSFGPLWAFYTSPDGTTGGVTGDCAPDCWVASHNYADLNEYASHGGNWYRVITTGTSASSGGPTGTGSNITDGSVHWTYVTTVSANMNGVANLLNEPALADDFAALATIMSQIPWWTLEAENLGSTGAIVSSGGGTAATWTNGSAPSGGGDWVVATVASDGNTMACYVPDPHTGSVTLHMTLMSNTCTAKWYDPTTGLLHSVVTNVSNTTTHAFTTPGPNAGGDGDWVLVVTANPLDPINFGTAA